MKKIIVFILAIIAIAGCKPKHLYFNHELTVDYRVYYPENTMDKRWTGFVARDGGVILSSDYGSNCLSIYRGKSLPWISGWPHICIEETTAPIEIINITKIYKDRHGENVYTERNLDSYPDE